MKLDLTPREARRLYEEIGDIPKSRVGLKLIELYRHLDALLAVEWNEKTLKQQQWRVG